MPFYAVPRSGKKGRDKSASDADAAHLTVAGFGLYLMSTASSRFILKSTAFGRGVNLNHFLILSLGAGAPHEK